MMNLRLLFLSAERNNNLLKQEVRNGIQAVKGYEKATTFSDLITITSISVKKEESDINNDESSIVEQLHSWQRDEDLQNEEEKDVQHLDDEVHLNDFYKLAEYLHSFSDAKCEIAENSLYILWCVENYIPCPSEVVEFYGVLERLGKWHNAWLSVVTNNFDAIEKWISFLPFQVVSSSKEVINDIFSTLWKGTLAFSIEGRNGLTLFPEVVLRTENRNSNLFTLSGIKHMGEPLYVLPTAEVFCEVDLNSVPLAFIQNGSLSTLSPSPYHMKGERDEVEKILNSLAATEGVGTLFRLRCSCKPPSLRGLEAINTQTWKQMIAEGNFDLNPTLTFEGHHEVIVFLMLPKGPDKGWVDCIALQDATLYGEDIVKLILQEQLKSPVNNENQKSKILNLLRETLELSQLQMDAFSYLLVNLPNTIKKRLKKKVQSIDNLSEEMKLQIECTASKELLSHLFLHPTSSVQIHSLNSTITSETRVSKECWPELKALEDKEKGKRNAIIRCTSGDFLCGLPPPVSPWRVTGMDAAHLLKCFEEGNKVKTKDSESNHEDIKRKFDWLKKMGWREALDTKYHGVYYNTSKKQAKFELMCSHLQERVVRNETASTCTLFQSQENTFVSQAKSKFKLRKEDPHKNQLPSKLMSGRQWNDADSCSVASSVKSLRFKSSNGQRTRTSPRKRIEGPLRRSPRKRVREEKGELKPSDLLCGKRIESKKSPVAIQRRNPKPADLSEVHKQKLRNVILSALEREGVSMKDELFKLCFKKLFVVCKPFALDVAGLGGTTGNFEKIAKAHVKQVIQFEKRKNTKRK